MTQMWSRSQVSALQKTKSLSAHKRRVSILPLACEVTWTPRLAISQCNISTKLSTIRARDSSKRLRCHSGHVVLTYSSLRTRKRSRSSASTSSTASRTRTMSSMAISTKGTCSTWSWSCGSARTTRLTSLRAPYARTSRVSTTTSAMRPSPSPSWTRCLTSRTSIKRSPPLSMTSYSLSWTRRSASARTFISNSKSMSWKIL